MFPQIPPSPSSSVSQQIHSARWWFFVTTIYDELFGWVSSSSFLSPSITLLVLWPTSLGIRHFKNTVLMNTIPIKLVVCVGLPAAGQAVSDHQKCSLLQAMQTNGVQVSVSCYFYLYQMHTAQCCGSHLFQCGFSFLSQCWSRPGSRESNKCGSGPSHKKLDFYMKNTYFW